MKTSEILKACIEIYNVVKENESEKIFETEVFPGLTFVKKDTRVYLMDGYMNRILSAEIKNPLNISELKVNELLEKYSLDITVDKTCIRVNIKLVDSEINDIIFRMAIVEKSNIGMFEESFNKYQKKVSVVREEQFDI